MTLPDDDGAAEDRRQAVRLRPLFALIVLVEALTLTALYIFGRYFS